MLHSSPLVKIRPRILATTIQVKTSKLLTSTMYLMHSQLEIMNPSYNKSKKFSHAPKCIHATFFQIRRIGITYSSNLKHNQFNQTNTFRI